MRRFDLEVVVNLLLPRAKQFWLNLYNEINKANITFAVLEKVRNISSVCH